MQWVIPHLIEAGYEVRGVDSFGQNGDSERSHDYEFIKGDLCDKGLVKRCVDGVDAIIQGAAQVYGVRGFHRYPADILSRDMELHQNLLWQAYASGVSRFVYISSSMVYEQSPIVPSCEEDVETMLTPKTAYGLSKLVGERLCEAFGEQYGLEFTIWRPFNIITPYERSEGDSGISHVFADYLRKIILEKQNPMTILGDGEQIRCFTWIDDVAEAIAKHSFTKETKGEIFNLGNPQPVTMKELASKIFSHAQERDLIDRAQTLEFTSRPIYDDDVRQRVPSIEKAKSRLGWRPTMTLDEALTRCIDNVTGELQLSNGLKMW